MLCELCGKETDFLFKTEIEGTTLSVCEECSKLGKVVSKVSIEKPEEQKQKQEQIEETETISVLVPDFAQKIKYAREKLNLKQEDVAKKTSIKESTLHSIESGKYEPSINLAKKLEKFFNIKLIEEEELTLKINENESKQQKNEKLTLGDIIKIKNK